MVAKSKPTMSLVSKTSNRSPTLDAGVFNSPENFGMQNQSSDLSGIGKPMAQMMNRLTEPSLTHHTFEIVNVPHLERAFANARQKFSRQDFKSATTKAAMHLGPDCEQNLCTAKYTDFEQLKTLFDISESLILNHRSEICGISTIEWHCTPWRRFTMLHNRAIKLSKAKVHVYSDSVFCLGEMHEHPISM